MDDEPACNDKTHGEEDGQDRQPISLAPPEREQKADAQDHTGDFAGDNVEAAEDEQGSDEGGAQVAGR